MPTDQRGTDAEAAPRRHRERIHWIEINEPEPAVQTLIEVV